MTRHDRFTLAELAALTGGRWDSPEPARGTVVGPVLDNSRQAVPGSLFVAVRGETADGHCFIPAAVAAGAAAVCADTRPLPAEAVAALGAAGVPCLRVPDTLLALHALARAHRRRWRDLLVVALTGSCGKTSTKEMLAAVLAARWPGAVLKTEGNTNNHFGVPRNLLRLGPEHRAAVIELGTNHPGEIATLVRMVEPQVAVVSNIGQAHLEFLGDLAGVAREKGAIFAGLPAAGGTAVYPAEAAHAEILRELAAAHRPLTFGAGPEARIRVEYMGARDGRYDVRLHWRDTGATALLRWGIGGAHQAFNAAAAAAVGTVAGLTPAAIVAALEHVVLPGMRMEVLNLDGVHWVNDAYNSNPTSAAACLAWFHELTAKVPAAARVLVLGDMRELGPENAPLAHAAILQACVERFAGATILAVGPQMTAAAPAGACGLRTFPDAAAAAPALAALLRPGSWVLLKGSRGMRLETLLPAAAPGAASAHA